MFIQKESYQDEHDPARAAAVDPAKVNEIKRFMDAPTIEWSHDLDPFLSKGAPLFNRRQGTVKGAVEFLNVSGRAVMRMMGASDFPTLIHESGHIFRRFLPPKLLAEAEEQYGVQGGVWTIPQEERFAMNFERYILDGHSPSREFAEVFQRMAGAMGEVYSSFYDRERLGEVSPPVRRIFAKMLGVEVVETAVEARALAELEHQVEVEIDREMRLAG